MCSLVPAPVHYHNIVDGSGYSGDDHLMGGES